jgi:DNA-directed RNA polymerase subunit RPC12/RpoP
MTLAKKTVGYVEMEWTCPNCGSKNPGMNKNCGTCGAPQPANVEFELGEKREIITDAQKVQAAAKGADIHCPYCGTRNPADAATCAQCGGDLKEGTKRASGRVLNAVPVQPGLEIKCPNCGTLNSPGNDKCSACGTLLTARAAVPAAQTATQAPGAASGNAKLGFFRPWMALPIIAVLLACCVTLGFLFFRTKSAMGVVQNVQWERVISIEALREVTREAWRDQVPNDGQIISCTQEYRTRQDNPAPNSKEVCSTAYVDKGNGVAEVVETCYYEVYDDYCKYTAPEWQQVDSATAQGADLQPYWPQVNLSNGEREGERKEAYTAYFETSDGVKEFTTDDAALFVQLQPGTQWTLTVNTFGQVVEVSP